MEYRKLGTSELRLSVITHGAFAIGRNMWGGNAKKDSIESIRASIDNGVTTLAIVMGTEGDGLRNETITEADYVVRIPMANGVDSLNVAATSAIAF